jgi:SagB-type dehydrogenase family enzyme
VKDGLVTPRALTHLVYPAGGEPELDDLAERYHEAAKTCTRTIGRELPGLVALETDATLRELVSHGVRRHAHRETISLPVPEPIDAGLTALLRARRSGREFGDAVLRLGALATLLHCAYGAVSTDVPPRRTVPSGGALYPLELYVVVTRVEALRDGIYHYDPLGHVLEVLELVAVDARLAELHVYPELATAPALLALTGVFGRSRFKYGLRGYRFTLLEAGHVLQNLVLAASGLKLSAIPVAGIDDRGLERLLRVDGVDESVVYCAAVGCPPEPA